MPFKKVNVSTLIEERLDADSELKEMWDSSRMEYALLGEIIKIRKGQGLSQPKLTKNYTKQHHLTYSPTSVTT